jgi:hypothetical protein
MWLIYTIHFQYTAGMLVSLIKTPAKLMKIMLIAEQRMMALSVFGQINARKYAMIVPMVKRIELLFVDES